MKNLLLRDKKKNMEILTLNNPEKLNALSEEMLSELQNAFDDISQNSSIKVVILRASGNAFCAGHDLKEMQLGRQAPDRGRKYFNSLFKKCGKLMITIRNLPQPVIAEVNGIATAAGCQLVATCDLAVASYKATFGVNGVNIGLFCSTPMVALSRNIGTKNTFEMLVTGEFLSSDSAERHGLVNKVVEHDSLTEETLKLASQISSKLSSAVKIGKQAFYRQSEMKLESAYEFTAEIMAENMLFQDTNEGINAFLEKRTPKWTKQSS